jgi:D-alanine-D-alanine ligase
MAHEFGFPILVEEFIFGREMTAALVEMPHLRMLPITEALFPPETQGYWPILSYDAKWNIDSHEYNATDYCFGAEIPAVLAEQLETLARKAFRILGARDYARVDFRIRRDTEPFLLELNPNPNFSPGKALANNLCAAGISHEEFTVQLVRNALARGSPSPTARYQIQVNGGVKAPLVMP